MKKKIIAAAFLAFFAGNAMADDAVVPTVHGSASGTSFVMNIGLTNAADYVAFQMDIKLPAGVTAGDITSYDRLKDGGTVTINSNSESTNFVITKAVVDATNNVIRVVGYNLGNHNIQAGTTYNDAMFKMPLTASAATNIGDFTASVSNAIFVKASDLTGAQLVAENGSLAATTGLLGDVTGDGVVDTEDKVAVINYYISRGTDPKRDTFIEKAADINLDNTIDTEDGVSIIRVYLDNNK